MPESGRRAPGAGGLRGIGRAFLQGMVEPSPLAAGVMLATALGLLAASAALITPGSLAAGLWRYLAAPGDDARWLANTAEWLDLARTPPRAPSVIVVGASSVDDAVDRDLLRRRLDRVAGGDVDLRVAVFRPASMWEIAALPDLLPAGPGRIVVLGVGPATLCTPRQLPSRTVPRWYLLPVGEAFRDERTRAGVGMPWSSGWYFVDRFRVLGPRLPRLARRLVTGPVEATDPTAPAPRPTDATLGRVSEAVLARLERYDAESARNLAILGRTVRRLRETGAADTVVLLEPPFNTAIFGDRAPTALLSRHRDVRDAFAAIHRVSWWDLDAEAGLTAADFRDHYHLDPAGDGRRRYTAALAGRLEPMVREVRP